jgi:hypothetical protein
MRKRVMVLVALVGCSPSLASEPPPAQPPGGKPKTEARCTGTIAEYCKGARGKCPTFAETLERLKSRCPETEFWRVSAERCVGSYRSISERNGLGSSEEYFDANGRLMAAVVGADSNAYCNRTSFGGTFGKVPTCTTRFVTIDVCTK